MIVDANAHGRLPCHQPALRPGAERRRASSRSRATRHRRTHSRAGRRPGRSRARSAGGAARGGRRGRHHWRRSPTWRSSGAGRSSSSRSERATTWRGISGSTAKTRSPHCGRSPGGRPRIDVARVNGRLFLNNVSLGLYARLVHEQDGGNTLAQLKALGLLLRHPGGLGVTVDGRNVHARVVVVSNNPYSLDVFSVGERERLDEGALHLYVAHGWLPENLGGARRHGVHGRRPSGIAARGDRRRAGAARDAAALRDRAGRATRASARARLAPLACAGTRGRRPRSRRARTSGTRRRRRAGSGTPSTMRAVQ